MIPVRDTSNYHKADAEYIEKEMKRLKEAQDKMRAIPSLAEIRRVMLEMNAKGIKVDRMIRFE